MIDGNPYRDVLERRKAELGPSDEELTTAVAEIFFPDSTGWAAKLAELQARVPHLDLERMVLDVFERMARAQERASQIRVVLPLPAPGGDDPLHDRCEKGAWLASQASAEANAAPAEPVQTPLGPAPTPAAPIKEFAYDKPNGHGGWGIKRLFDIRWSNLSKD